MAILRISEIPENRREIAVDVEMEVAGFRNATAALARDLRKTATDDFRDRVMRLWAEFGESGGFAMRNGKHGDSWVLFEYEGPKPYALACCTSEIGPVCGHRKGL